MRSVFSGTIFLIESLPHTLLFHSVFELANKKFQKVVEESNEELLAAPSDMMIAVNDFVALFLEILNSIITSSLKSNSHLTYMLLQRKELIEFFSDYLRFRPLANNILIVSIQRRYPIIYLITPLCDQAISFFNEKIEAANVEIPTVDVLMSIIDKGNQTWSSATRLSAIPPTKFLLTEESETHQFLNPFCWHFMVQKGIVQNSDDWTFIDQ